MGLGGGPSTPSFKGPNKKYQFFFLSFIYYKYFFRTCTPTGVSIFYILCEKSRSFRGRGVGSPPPFLIGDMSPKKSSFFTLFLRPKTDVLLPPKLNQTLLPAIILLSVNLSLILIFKRSLKIT